MNEQKAPPKRSYLVSSKPIRIRSHRHGTIKLRRLSVGTSGFLYTLVDLNLPAREFAVQLIHRYLISPELDLETIRAWPDRLLLRVELGWVQELSSIKDSLPDDKPTFDMLQRILVEYIAEQTQKLRDAIRVNLGHWIAPSNVLLSSIQSTMQNINQALIQSTMQNINQALADSVQSSMHSLIQQASQAFEESTSKLFQSAIDSFSESIRIVSQGIITTGLDQLNNLRPLLPTLSDLSAFAQLLEESRIVGEEFEASGYRFTAHLWDMAFVDSLIRVSPKVRKAALTNKVLAITRSQEFEQNLQELCVSLPLLRRRWKIVKLALEYHQRREYLASVPLLLAQVEGLFTDAMILYRMAAPKGRKLYARGSDDKLILNAKMKPIEVMTLRAKVDYAPKFKSHAVLKNVIDLFLDQLIAERNNILHGRRTAYGTAKLSNQLLLLIYVLANEITKFFQPTNSA